MKKNLVLICLHMLFMIGASNAQAWVNMMLDPNANFYETVDAFNDYWSGRPIVKGEGYKQFRRWQHFMTPRVYPKGDVKLSTKARAYEEYQKYLLTHPITETGARAASWTPMGPTGAPSGGGAGRTNFLRFDPVNSAIVYTGSPGGGLWKSTNSGTSWTTNTDQLSVIGCTDIAIDPSNTNIMYLATGDGDGSDTYSIGVLKSTDGGTTWSPSGLSWTVDQGRVINRLLIHPTTPSTLIAITSNGIYRTTNSGTSWSQVQTGNFKDAEFKPGDPNTVYAAGTSFYLSTSGGASWSNITSGLPSSFTVGRLAIGVTSANADYVYLLAANTSNGFLGVYRSTNSGTSFTTRTTSPNILGWDNGGDAGGQGWYDLCIAVSNTNAEEVFTGGVNIWRSTNGGSTFTLNSHWYGGYSKPYVHADIHDLIFLPGSGTTLWSANDGGVFRTTNNGTSWSDLSANLQIAQQYRLGLSSTTSTLLVTGHQDNGTNKMSGTAWSQIYGGDGMDCFVDRTNDNTIFASYVYGDFQRSTNGGVTWTNIVSGLTGSGDWLSPWHQDPVSATTLYAGYQNLFKSTNSGTSWTALAALPGSSAVVEFDVAPSNNQYIYVVKYNGVYKTTNGGSSWSTVTSTLPVGSAYLTNIEISPTDPQKVWVTFSGYSSGNKVFYTSNGGTSWTNISAGLPNIPINCIVYEVGSSDGLYLGTDVGVYYLNSSLTSWQSYMAGLPNVVVTDLEIFYPGNKLRAATYGRGTWESDLYSAVPSAPVADFSATPTTICPGQTVNFTDLSTYSPTSWSWTFTGGVPATSTLQNPSVVYNTPGTYAVTLTATNASGSDSETKTAYITVTSALSLPLTEGFESTTFVPANWISKDANLNGEVWVRNSTLGAYGTSAACAMWDNYTHDEAGARDELQTPKYNFSSISTATLTFDVAYARYDAANSDSLAVLVSTDCGVTFTQVYLKGGTTLSTNGGIDVSSKFTPTTSQWRNESISLSSYAGQASVMIAFQNRGHYGQPIYLDNINITTASGTAPVADFTASITTVCAGQSVTFTNTSTGTSTYSWTFTGGTPSTSTATNPTITYNTPGTYNVSLVGTGAGGSDTETKSGYIVVSGAPTTSNAGADQTICGATATLNGNSPATGTGIWTFVSGPATPVITTPTSNNSGVTGLTTSGTYVFRWTISNGPCVASTDDVNIIVNEAPTTSNAGTDQVICASTASLAGNTPTIGTGTWTFVSGPTTPTIVTPGSPTTTINGMTVSGNYIFRWNIANAGCIPSTDDVTITRNGNPTTANAGTDKTICTASTTLNGNTPSIGTGTWTFVSGPSTPVISSVTSPSTSISGLSVLGTYTFQWTISNPPCIASSDVVTVTVTGPPTVIPTSNSPICEGETLSLTTPAVSGATYSWSGVAGFSSTLQSPSIVSTTTSMSGTYVITVSLPGCSNTSSINVVIHSLPPNPVITQSLATLTATPSTGFSYQWYLDGVAIPGATGSSYTATSNGVYTVEISDEIGCTTISDQFSFTSLGNGYLHKEDNSVLIYPNPSEGHLTIALKDKIESGSTDVYIYNSFGQVVYARTVLVEDKNSLVELNLEQLSKGHYTLVVSYDNKSFKQKLVIY